MGNPATTWRFCLEAQNTRRIGVHLGAIFGKWRVVAAGAALLVLFGASTATATEAQDRGPRAFAVSVGEQFIIALGEHDQVKRDRRFRNIMLGALDLETIGQRALGRHWRRLSQAERTQYQKLFRDYVVNLYAMRFGHFAGERFSVLRHRAAATGESVVLARIIRQFGLPLDVSFKLRKTDFGYKIVDVGTAGVSLVVTKRAEFDAIVRREGLAGLLHRLSAKSTEALLQSKQSRISPLAEVVTVLHAGRALRFQ